MARAYWFRAYELLKNNKLPNGMTHIHYTLCVIRIIIFFKFEHVRTHLILARALKIYLPHTFYLLFTFRLNRK